MKIIRPLRFRHALVALAALMLSACATLDSAPPVKIERTATWVVLPFSNATETPLAAQRAESIALGLLPSLGVANPQRYPQSMQDDSLFDTGQARGMEQAMNWARSSNARYALAGSVQEWRYKVGVDGEPAVGVSLQIIEVSSGKLIWSSVGARSGWSRDTLAGVAQGLMKRMLEAGIGKR